MYCRAYLSHRKETVCRTIVNASIRGMNPEIKKTTNKQIPNVELMFGAYEKQRIVSRTYLINHYQRQGDTVFKNETPQTLSEVEAAN